MAAQPPEVASAAEPTYSDAISLLNSTQTGYKVLEARRKAGIRLDTTDDPIAQMKAWLGYIGHAPKDLDRLNVVHVAGTKGKGTTCAFTNSILERYRSASATSASSAPSLHKIGLYTSPHLVAVRERIRINSEPISEALFTRYFFEVWRAFEAGATASGADPAIKPSYFRFLTLLSFHVFLREGVDAAIYEVGVGGELDATNVFVQPAATAITTLGIDHVETLGATVDKIAWHKAGILKEDCPAFTIPQDPLAMAVLQQRAAERKVAAPGLRVLEPELYTKQLANVRLMPAEEFQRKNAAVAVSLAATVLGRIGVTGDDNGDVVGVLTGGPLPSQFVDGLEQVVWRGRCETKVTGRQRWYLDGAHNQQSLEVACQWFRRTISGEKPSRKTINVLIFNQQSTRESIELLHVVHKTLFDVTFGYAIFCTNVTYKNNSWKVDFVNNNVDPALIKSLSLQQDLAGEWRKISPMTETVTAMPTIEDAIDYVRQIEGGDVDARVLITGSFHLIGGALTILEDGEDFALANMSAAK
ncbi:folylpolyglutamate synthase [Sporothrix brasiliensis 5110]|uniref:Folylpolyglutamate synthase n=1 Tax=Sporothrix brasiliensis 5110 TaxID=1398154 RepID=A0A0C2IJ61_9PEZI|nr:folylpolyglutamate synthase [Sporothrix brasiliensis 5110]KIH89176.1 folylpolyglutamate synthase [Sporothrix brasiliensis 5110]